MAALLPFLERAAIQARQRLAAGDPEVADPGSTGMDAVIALFDTAGGTLLVQRALHASSPLGFKTDPTFSHEAPPVRHRLHAPLQRPATHLACYHMPQLLPHAICSPAVQACRCLRSSNLSTAYNCQETEKYGCQTGSNLCCRERCLCRRCRSRLTSCASHLLRLHVAL